MPCCQGSIELASPQGLCCASECVQDESSVIVGFRFVAFWLVFLLLLGFFCCFNFLKHVMVSKAEGGVFSVLLASELAMDLVFFIRIGQCVQAMIRPKLH